MTAEDIWHRVRRVAADIFDLPPEAITAQSSPDSVENWDSLQHVNLVLALEQTFDVQFLPEEIAEMLTVGRIASLVEQKLGAKVA